MVDSFDIIQFKIVLILFKNSSLLRLLVGVLIKLKILIGLIKKEMLLRGWIILVRKSADLIGMLGMLILQKLDSVKLL
ncbi:hypothetical protein DJ94_4540 [Bacillus pseudomycoides]|nr:hypothetical protein DJ94_4540 [Bacillus pseudomycoides]